MAGGEDPFAEFLSQEAAPLPDQVPAVYAAAASEPVDSGMQLRLLVESSLRQEQLLGKICSLLVSHDEKLGRLAANQSALEARLEGLAAGGGGYAAGPVAVQAKSATGSFSGPRGSLVSPPGVPGAPRPAAAAPTTPQQSYADTAAQRAERERLEAERLAVERLRIEEEARRRAEELARQREEAERRRREEAERQRIEEERRREEERQRKAALENKTSAAMSSLLTGAGAGGGLFGDEEGSGKPKKKGGLFDDDD